jgi:hypothetical protein
VLRRKMPLVIAFSVHFPYSDRAQVLPLMLAEIAQQLSEHGRFLHLWLRADNTTLGETMVPTNRGENPKRGGNEGQIKDKM